MKSLHYHPHLVSMLGYVPDARNPLLLVEYCAKGDLLHFVRNHRAEIEHVCLPMLYSGEKCTPISGL